MKYIFSDKNFRSMFSEGQINHYMKENNFTELEAFLYLWAFNNFSVHSPDDLKDLGRPMYRKLAKSLAKLFVEQDALDNETNKREKTESVCLSSFSNVPFETQSSEHCAKKILVEKKVYDCILRNSINLMAENETLKEKLDIVKANGNYPSKVSQLKARVTNLAESCEDKDIEITCLKDSIKRCKEVFKAFNKLGGLAEKYLDSFDTNDEEK